MSRLIKTLHTIFSRYGLLDAFVISFMYLMIVVHGRMGKKWETKERVLFLAMQFPYRNAFFGQFIEIFCLRSYEFPNEKAALSIIDCGSNIGTSAAYFKWRSPKAAIACIEPNPEAVEYLRKNIGTDRRAAVFPFALGASEGEAELVTEGKVQASTGASLQSLQRTHSIENSKVIRIKTRTLSSFIDKPIDFIKIDIEGAEGEVLEELKASGKLGLVRALTVEYHADAVPEKYTLDFMCSLLRAEGFEVALDGAHKELVKEKTRLIRAYRNRIENR